MMATGTIFYSEQRIFIKARLYFPAKDCMSTKVFFTMSWKMFNNIFYFLFFKFHAHHFFSSHPITVEEGGTNATLTTGHILLVQSYIWFEYSCLYLMEFPNYYSICMKNKTSRNILFTVGLPAKQISTFFGISQQSGSEY